MTGLAYAADRNPATAVENEIDRALKLLIEPGDQSGDRGRLDFKHFARKLQSISPGGQRSSFFSSGHVVRSIAKSVK